MAPPAPGTLTTTQQRMAIRTRPRGRHARPRRGGAPAPLGERPTGTTGSSRHGMVVSAAQPGGQRGSLRANPRVSHSKSLKAPYALCALIDSDAWRLRQAARAAAMEVTSSVAASSSFSILASNLMVDSASSSSRVPCASNQQCTRNAKCNSRCAIDRVSWSGHENKRPTNRR